MPEQPERWAMPTQSDRMLKQCSSIDAQALLRAMLKLCPTYVTNELTYNIGHEILEVALRNAHRGAAQFAQFRGKHA